MALAWPEKIVTLAGTVRAAVLLDIATIVELLAACVSDTVQVLDALLPKVAGEHEIEVSWAGAVALMLKD